MLKKPAIDRGHMFGPSLTFESAANWCRFIADDLEWKDEDATYWHRLATQYQGFVDRGMDGAVSHPRLEEKISLMSRPS